MSVLTCIILVFSVLGALDWIFSSKFGLGKEFERGFRILGDMALSMIGMIIISPFLADVMRPFFSFVNNVIHVDPSIIPASLFANDMGGAPLAVEVATNEKVGMFNALVVSAMMGATISFTVPVSLGMVKKENHRELLLGLLCGIVTIPVGCFVSGLVCGLGMIELIINLLPLVLFSAIVAIGLIKCPTLCVKVFGAVAFLIKVLITIGLVLGIIRFLSGYEVIKGLETIENASLVCLNASVVMTGAFPFMFVVSKLLSKPLGVVSRKTGINETSAVGFISSLATNLTTLGMMNDMDKRGVLMNAAFAVSASFTFAGHLAFTMAFNENYIFPMIIGKLVAGVSALVLSYLLFCRKNKVNFERK